MVGQFLQMRQGDNEQVASRVTFELEEQTASAVREEQLRGEYAQAADALRTDQQNIFAQSRLRTVESALGCEYASAQQNLQQQYLSQVQGLHHELQTGTMSCRLRNNSSRSQSLKKEPRTAGS